MHAPMNMLRSSRREWHDMSARSRLNEFFFVAFTTTSLVLQKTTTTSSVAIAFPVTLSIRSPFVTA